MTLIPDTKLGPYEILAALGAGSMGEVYKAKDTRLDCFVAVKVLPRDFARNPDALGRFERGAETVRAEKARRLISPMPNIPAGPVGGGGNEVRIGFMEAPVQRR